MNADLAAYRKPGYYIKRRGHIVCLNCTTYFKSRCNTTRLDNMAHEGWNQARFCPVCGCELKEEIDPYKPEQLTLKVKG